MGALVTNEEVTAAMKDAAVHAERVSAAFHEVSDRFQAMQDAVTVLRESIRSRVF